MPSQLSFLFSYMYIAFLIVQLVSPWEYSISEGRGIKSYRELKSFFFIFTGYNRTFALWRHYPLLPESIGHFLLFSSVTPIVFF